LTDCVVVEAKVRGWNRHSSSDGCVVVLVLQLAPGLGPLLTSLTFWLWRPYPQGLGDSRSFFLLLPSCSESPNRRFMATRGFRVKLLITPVAKESYCTLSIEVLDDDDVLACGLLMSWCAMYETTVRRHENFPCLRIQNFLHLHLHRQIPPKTTTANVPPADRPALRTHPLCPSPRFSSPTTERPCSTSPPQYRTSCSSPNASGH
jgi:hypothetical protein